MSLDKNNSQYSKIAKLFHWGFVLLVVYGVAKQVDDINQLEDQAFFRFEIIFNSRISRVDVDYSSKGGN